MYLILLDETDEMNQSANVDLSKVFGGEDESKAYEKVDVGFDTLHELTPEQPGYQFKMDYSVSEDYPEIPTTTSQMVHPNDPSLDVVQQPQQQRPVYSPIVPLMPHNPVGAIQSEIFRQQQAQLYATGQTYLNQRGPMYYQFNNPNGVPNIRRFQDDMNKVINDPIKMGEIVTTKPQVTLEYTGLGMSAEEYKDTHYEREAKDAKDAADALRKSRFGYTRQEDPSSVPDKQVSYREMKKRMRNENTPETSFNNYTVKTRSGEELLHLGGGNKAFTDNEVQSAYERASKEYEEQKKAILAKKPVVYDSGYTKPRFFDPTDYHTYMNSMYNRPKFYPGYGYMSVSGYPDGNGLPTVWYDDGGRFLIPTQDDIDNQNVPIAKVHVDGLSDKEDVPKRMEPKKKANDKVGVIVAYSTEVRDGVVYEKLYNSLTDEFSEEARLESEEDDYSSMGKQAISQYKKDDTYVLAEELSRYNVELADILAWLRYAIDFKDFIMFKRYCQEQLREYRDNDPLCMYKSTVIIANDSTLVLKSKPVTLERFEEDFRRIHSIEHTGGKLYNIFKRYMISISEAKTLEDKLAIIRKARDIEVIPRDKDMVYQRGLEIIKDLDTVKKNNFSRYKFWKGMYRGAYKGVDNFEITYAEWWNRPRKQLSKNEYEKAYKERMMDLSRGRFFDLSNLPPLTENPMFNKRMEYNAREWNRLSEGRFNKPGMTFNDFIVAMNVTDFNIRLENIVKKRMDAWKNRSVDSPDFNRSILDQIIDKNIENLGLTPVIKLPRYAPVSLSGIDKTMDVETRRQRFIDRIFARKGRPTV